MQASPLLVLLLVVLLLVVLLGVLLGVLVLAQLFWRSGKDAWSVFQSEPSVKKFHCELKNISPPELCVCSSPVIRRVSSQTNSMTLFFSMTRSSWHIWSSGNGINSSSAFTRRWSCLTCVWVSSARLCSVIVGPNRANRTDRTVAAWRRLLCDVENGPWWE